MYPIRGEAGSSDVEYQVVLYIRLVYNIRVARHRVPGPGVRDEYAQAPPETQSHLGLLKPEGFPPAQIVIIYNNSTVDIIAGIGRMRLPDRGALSFLFPD
jgi:hypothetical protein